MADAVKKFGAAPRKGAGMKADVKKKPAARNSNRPSLLGLRVTPKTLVEETKHMLREAIFAGRLKPGDRLVEVDLSVSMGVSRPVVREAIRGLHAERLCEIAPHRGAQVPILSWENAEQIYHVRSLLEGEAAALCAANITDEGIKELEDKLKKFGEAVAKHDEYQRVEATTQFYSTILRSCGNSVVQEVLLGLLARINFLRAQSMSNPGRSKKSHVEMKAILDAIKLRNPQQARLAAQAHVEKAKESARIVFSNDAKTQKADRR
jgi:GntR family transcriptional regulator, trigonelline degradation regulator